MKKNRIKIFSYLEPDIEKKIKALAKREDRSFSYVVNQLLKKALG